MTMTTFDEYKILAESGLFDISYYIDMYGDIIGQYGDPILEYIEVGARARRNPNSHFDTEYYLKQCEALGERPHNPLLHFIQRGASLNLKFRADDNNNIHAQNIIFIPVDNNVASEDILLHVEYISFTIHQNEGIGSLKGSGWCVARSQIRHIRISAGEILTHAYFGQLRHDIGMRFPRYPKSDHSGFRFTLDGIPVSERDNFQYIINVEASGGIKYEKIHIVPHQSIFVVNNNNTSQFDSGKSDNPLRTLPPMQLVVDSVFIDNKYTLQVLGWAVCLAPIVAVQIFVGDEQIGAADYGKPRDDVALALPAYPNARNSGFVFTANVSSFCGEQRIVRVQAIASTGISREVLIPCDMLIISAPSINTPDSTPNIHCDKIHLTTTGDLTIDGWAVMPEKISHIDILLNGENIGHAECHIGRPDVGNAFPQISHARNSGFSCHIVGLDVQEGEHLVIIRVCAGEIIHDTVFPILPLASDGVNSNGMIYETAGNDALKLNLDAPHIIAGCVETPVRNNLEISGWALARHGIDCIDIVVDGEKVATTFPGIRRLDVMMNFPDWQNSLTSGFSTLLPYRALPKGRHKVSIVLRGLDGNATSIDFFMDVEEAPETFGPWSLVEKVNMNEQNVNMTFLSCLSWHPMFSIVIDNRNNNKQLDGIKKTILSILKQVYENWRLRIIIREEDGLFEQAQTRILEGMDVTSGKIEFTRSSRILSSTESDSTQRALFCLILCPGDELGSDALLEFAASSATDRQADFLYADERRISPVSDAIEAWFKPGWSPDLLLSANYIGRAWCARADLVDRTMAGNAELFPNGDYDSVLRLTENANCIRHIPKVLFQNATDTVESNKDQTALEIAIGRRGINGQILKGHAPSIFRLKRSLKDTPRVSIIIPTCAARGLIKTCIKTLRNETAYRNFEIICIENIPESEAGWKKFVRAHADKVISTREPFNWSRFNNLCVEESEGDLLLFLNDDIEVIDPNWLDALLEHSQRPEVGAVGAQLLYPDGRVQHAGMFLAGTGTARHPFRFADADDPGYFALALTQRNVIAVTGACLLTRRETFDALGGFDETHDVVNNDLDYCLRG